MSSDPLGVGRQTLIDCLRTHSSNSREANLHASQTTAVARFLKPRPRFNSFVCWHHFDFVFVMKGKICFSYTPKIRAKQDCIQTVINYITVLHSVNLQENKVTTISTIAHQRVYISKIINIVYILYIKFWSKWKVNKKYVIA